MIKKIEISDEKICASEENPWYFSANNLIRIVLKAES